MSDAIDTGVNVRNVSANTPGLTAKRLAFKDIPVIDFSGFDLANTEDRQRIATEVAHACETSGFFYVSNHTVTKKTIDSLLSHSQAFFDQSLAEKSKIDIKHSSFSRGYIPMYGEKNNEHSEGDLKESFDIAIEISEDDPDYLAGNPLYGPNQRPANVPGFNRALDTYFESMTQLSGQLYRAFALSLDLPENYFLNMLDKPLDILRLLRYPPQPVIDKESQIGTGAHSDFDCFTILYQDPTGGLQALNSEDEWIDARPVEGTFLINVGDMLERWTNGRFVSTVHRVINRSEKQRFSIVFFAAPNYHTMVECLPSCCADDNPPRFEPISAGDYIVSRYEAVLV